jgi:hypothetical protein
VPQRQAITDCGERAARFVSRRCLVGPSRFVTALGTTLLPDPLLVIDETADGRWAARLAENTPACGIGVPLLVRRERRTPSSCLASVPAAVTDLIIIMKGRAGEGLPTLRPAPLGPRLAASRRTP